MEGYGRFYSVSRRRRQGRPQTRRDLESEGYDVTSELSRRSCIEKVHSRLTGNERTFKSEGSLVFNETLMHDSLEV